MRRRGRLSAGGRAHFGFEAPDYARIRAHAFEPNKASCEDAYAILGVAAVTPLSETRIGYRRLVSESHPHLFMAQGLTPECVAFATTKTARINAAYERLA